jgi:hypothetical protein
MTQLFYEILMEFIKKSSAERVRPDQVSVVDRFVMRNTKMENSKGVSGTVRNWNVLTSVQIIGTNHVVEKVSLERLRPITVSRNSKKNN